MNSFATKFALLSTLSAGALLSLAVAPASAQTPWDVYRQQYQLSTGATGTANQPAAPARVQSPAAVAGQSGAAGAGAGQGRVIQSETPVVGQTGATVQGTPGAGAGQGRIIQSETVGTGQPGQGAAGGQGRVIQSEIPATGQPGQGTTGAAGQTRIIQSETPAVGQQAPGASTTAGAAGARFDFTNQDVATLQGSQGAEGLTRYLQQGVSVETATVPQLASAIAQYAATNSEMIIGAVASLAAAYPDQAVKIAEAARLALPDRALEVAMAVATVVPAAAIQIVVALAAADPALAPTLAGLILPAAGGINQTSAARGGIVTQQEIPVIVAGLPPTTPGDNNASPNQ